MVSPTQRVNDLSYDGNAECSDRLEFAAEALHRLHEAEKEVKELEQRTLLNHKADSVSYAYRHCVSFPNNK